MARLLAALSTLLVLAINASASDVREGRPNIILILTDDHGWSQTTYLADPRVPDSCTTYLETPQMSRLASEGMRFTSGYSPAPLCTPTRRSILCGAATARCGSEFKSDWVPAEHATIPRVLKQIDPSYRCAHFGKWGEQMISTPEECGYDASDGMTGNNTGGMPATLGVESGHADGPPHFIDEKDPKRTRSVTDRALAFMTSQTEARHPFYLQISYYAQHLSVVCTQEGLARYEAKGGPDRGYTPAWAAMMDELDAAVGRVLDTVDALGIGERTYIFFTADNGGRGTIPGGDAKGLPLNAPLTGAKHSLYEGGIRVPFVARGPGIAPGSVCHTPVVGYDFLATFRDLAAGDASSLEPLDGVDGLSIRPLFRDPGRTDLGRPGQAIVFHRPGNGFSALRKPDTKLMVFWRPDGTVERSELYDLSRDPREEGHDLAASQPDRVRGLRAELLGILGEVGAETPADFAKPKRTPAKAARPR